MDRVVARELMDEPVESIAELVQNLRDIERANRFLGGVRPVVAAVLASDARTVLDVGCGSADIPRSIARGARLRGRTLAVTCLDRSPQMIEIARARSAELPELAFVVADGEALPFGDAAFDAVTCNLALHHFEPPAAVRLLRELRRVARTLPLVCDLRRSRLAYAGAVVLAGCSRNRLTRHDAPLSVLRAYTPPEALALARAAEWRAPRVRSTPFYRMVLADAV